MRLVATGALVALALVSTAAIAQPKYGPGTSATEIKIGQTIAYSGPASAYGQLGKVEAAYFKWLNAKGGINGRKINFISLDDGYSPPKAVENARKLVESDQVGAGLQRAGHAAQHGDPALPQPEEGAAALHRRRRHRLQRSRAVSLDHGLAAQPAGRGRLLRQGPAGQEARTPRSRCSTRTTISARTCCNGLTIGAGRQGQGDDRRQRRTSRRPIRRSTAS